MQIVHDWEEEKKTVLDSAFVHELCRHVQKINVFIKLEQTNESSTGLSKQWYNRKKIIAKNWRRMRLEKWSSQRNNYLQILVKDANNVAANEANSRTRDSKTNKKDELVGIISRLISRSS